MAHALALSAVIIKASASSHNRTSEILRDIAERCDHRWTVGDITAALGKRCFGLMLLIFALPNAIPLPIPGVSTLTSLPLMFFAAQLALGRDSVWLPQWVAKRGIAGDKLKLFLMRAIPWLVKLEKVVKPCAESIGGRFSQRIAGALILVLACLIALPIPLGNLPLGIAMTVLALAMTERDGWVMISGWLLTVFALVYFVLLIAGYGWLLWQALGFVS